MTDPLFNHIQPVFNQFRSARASYGCLTWFMQVLGDFWAFLGYNSQKKGTPKRKNGAPNILICLLDPIKSLGTAGWWKKEFLKTALHYCSITRSAMPNYLLERWGDIWTVYRQLWKDNATGQCHSHWHCHHHLPHHPHIVVMVITIVIFITIVSAYKS